MIFLASTSPRRRVLLKRAGLRFKILRPPYAEISRGRVSAVALTKRHALGKALSVAPRVKEGVILGSDTVVLFRGSALGKPRTMKAAERMLGLLSGRRHTVVTAVALLKMEKGRIRKRRVFVEKSAVFLKKMGPAALRRYLRRIGPLDKAGAWAA